MKYGAVSIDTLVDTAVHYILKRKRVYSCKSVPRSDLVAVMFDRFEFFTGSLTNEVMQKIAAKVGGEYVESRGRYRIVFN